jgi:hypothetical protein
MLALLVGGVLVAGGLARRGFVAERHRSALATSTASSS